MTTEDIKRRAHDRARREQRSEVIRDGLTLALAAIGILALMILKTHG